MNAKDIFGVIVRTIGLGCISYGLRYAMSWIYVLARPNSVGESWTGLDYLICGVLFLAMGFFLLRGADCVVRFAYPKCKEQELVESKDVT
jgi:hypothetical protein